MFAKVLTTCALMVCTIDVAAVEPLYGAADAGMRTACRDFLEMDAGGRTELVKQLAGSNDADVSATDADTEDAGDAKPTAGDYSVNSVVAVCQNEPDSTIGEAIAKGSGGTSEGTSGTSDDNPQ